MLPPMKAALALLLLLAPPALAGEAETLCATNPAYSEHVMLAVVQTQLQHDHDPALDADTPEHLADAAVAQGIAECAADLRANPSIATALQATPEADRSVAWDAYNTACADHKASKSACIQAEVGAADALKRMIVKNQPPTAKALAQTCQLVMKEDPAMVEWRSCVDQALPLNASRDLVERCKVRVNYHVATTGAEAAQVINACLKAG